MISSSAWKQRFAGDPAIVGRVIRLNGTSFTIIGIAPEGFTGATKLHSPELWAPLSALPQLRPASEDVEHSRNANFLGLTARMKSDASLEATRAGAEAVLAGLAETHPRVYEGTGIRVVPLDAVGTQADYARLTLVLMGLVAVLLLLACVNVANMLLARSGDRRAEIAVRLSLGASRGRVVRQLVVEGLVLAMFAASVGVTLALGIIVALNEVALRSSSPLGVALELDAQVLLFSLATAVCTVVVFGLAPAVQASRPAHLGATRSGGVGGSRGTSRLTAGLVTGQTALSVVLLMCAALFLRSLWTAGRTDLGFDADRLLAADVLPSLSNYRPAEAEAYYEELADRLARRDDVSDVTWTDAPPFGGPGRRATRVTAPVAPPRPASKPPQWTTRG